MNKFLVLFWHNRHLLVFVTKLMFLKYGCQKPMKKNCGRPAFLEELQAAINFSKVSLHFNKISNSLRHILQKYQRYIFCVLQKKSSRSIWRKLILNCQGNLVMKLDDDVVKFIYIRPLAFESSFSVIS